MARLGWLPCLGTLRRETAKDNAEILMRTPCTGDRSCGTNAQAGEASFLRSDRLSNFVGVR